MRKLVIELVSSQTTQTKPLFGAVFNNIVSKKLIEDFQNLTDIVVIMNENMKIDEDFRIYISQSRVKVETISRLSEIKDILPNDSDVLYFSPMNLHGFEFLPNNVKSASVVHDIRDYVIYSTALKNIENERLHYAINKYNSLNDLMAYCLSHFSPWLYGKIMNMRGEKWLSEFIVKLKKADGIIFNSMCTQKRVTSVSPESFNGKKVAVIYPPVNRTESNNLKTSHENIPESFFLMLSAGRKEKNLNAVLAGFEEFCKQNEKNPFFLVLTGTTSQLEKHIKKKYKYAGKVICVPYTSQENVDHLISNCTALLMPSIDEGFGHPVLEAMNAGAPIVCSDIPIFREISDGYSTFFKYNDSKALSEILYLFSKPKYRENQSIDERANKGVWYKDESELRLDSISSFVLSLLLE